MGFFNRTEAERQWCADYERQYYERKAAIHEIKAGKTFSRTKKHVRAAEKARRKAGR